ncbi:MAG: glycosyltransferase [Candidatus Acidiferrales bacterium]
MSTTPSTNQVTTANNLRQAGGAAAPAKDASGKGRNGTTLSVIVPAYNEQYLIEASLKGLAVLEQSSFLQRITVIVVNDCSTDATAEAIRRFQAALQGSEDFKKFSWVWLQHEKNMGKGAAIRTALAYVDTQLVVIHDADLEYHPRDLLQMVELFLYEDADAVFGSRFLSGGYKRALFFRHEVGNKFLTLLCDLVCDLNLTDMETCYKMVRADLLKSIPLQSSTFDVEPELAIKLAKRGARIFEVPISYSGRTYAEGKKISWKDGVRALWAIFHYALSDKIYAADGHGGEILQRLNRAPRFTRWMADVIRPYRGDRVLEIGAGIGNLTLNLIPRAVYWATDVNSDYLEALEKLRANRPYLHVAHVNAMDENSFPPGESFDTVIFLNVLEHLEDDRGALRNVYNVLQNGGVAVVLVPNGPKLYGTLDEVLGHCRRYTEKHLSEVGQSAGFTVERVIKFNRTGVVAWWLNGRILRRKTFGLAQVRLLNLLTPVFRVVDPWLPLPPLSLIAIFRKQNGSAPVAPPVPEFASDPNRAS